MKDLNVRFVIPLSPNLCSSPDFVDLCLTFYFCSWFNLILLVVFAGIYLVSCITFLEPNASLFFRVLPVQAPVDVVPSG